VKERELTRNRNLDKESWPKIGLAIAARRKDIEEGHSSPSVYKKFLAGTGVFV
jgi:hypothetical protein